MDRKLAIVITHPIQYYAPIFKLLAERQRVRIKVFYTWEKGAATFDKGFGKQVEWDIPLLEGYEYEFVSNNGNKKRSFWSLRNPNLINSIVAWKANAVLIIGWNYYSHLEAILYFKTKIPVLFRGDSTLLNERNGIRLLLRRIMLKWVYKNTDLALYVGKNNKAYYLKHGLKNEQLIFAPHAIDNVRFVNGSSEAVTNDLNNQIDFPTGSIVFLFAGKLDDNKNPLLLIKAFKELGKINAFLLIVGSGNLENEVKDAIKSDNRIRWLPFQNQTVMPSIYKYSDVFVMPSKSETWGLAVNEAMACSRAVITSDKVGCAIDLIDEGKNGYIFKSTNCDSLKEKMLLCMDKQKLFKMGISSFDKISSWSYAHICRVVEELVDNINLST